MQGFLDIALGFPTVFWTALLGLVVAYWLFVIVGALDIELLDFDVETDFDIDLDADFDADIDADAAGDGSDSGANPLVKVAVALGLGKVPITILISFFVFSGWFVSYFGDIYLTPILGGGAVGAVLLGLAFVLAIPMMGAMAHPLKGVFETSTRSAGHSVIGQVCTISTGSVDMNFGQARLDDGGAGLLLNVRCPTGDNTLRKNSQALIIGHDAEHDVYFVESYEQFLEPSGHDELHAAGEQIEQLVNTQREA